MKKILVSVGIATTLLLAACSNTDNKDPQISQEETSEAQETKGQIVNGLRIDVLSQEVNERITEEETQTLYTFTVSGKNMASTMNGLGSSDFALKTTDGEMVELDYTMAMFGDEIEPNETIEGTVTFALSEEQVPAKLVYRIGDNELAEWDVNAY